MLENDGNSKSNISLISTALFTSSPNTSSNYQFKADNASGWGLAFNWVKSLVSWTNMSITGSLIAITELNYTGQDRAEVDLWITVPSVEPIGTRSANVTLAASLAE